MLSPQHPMFLKQVRLCTNALRATAPSRLPSDVEFTNGRVNQRNGSATIAIARSGLKMAVDPMSARVSQQARVIAVAVLDTTHLTVMRLRIRRDIPYDLHE